MEKRALARLIALRVNAAREKANNMPVYQLSSLSGMNLSSVQRLCSGNAVQVSAWMVKHVAEALDTTADALMY